MRKSTKWRPMLRILALLLTTLISAPAEATRLSRLDSRPLEGVIPLRVAEAQKIPAPIPKPWNTDVSKAVANCDCKCKEPGKTTFLKDATCLQPDLSREVLKRLAHGEMYPIKCQIALDAQYAACGSDYTFPLVEAILAGSGGVVIGFVVGVLLFR